MIKKTLLAAACVLTVSIVALGEDDQMTGVRGTGDDDTASVEKIDAVKLFDQLVRRYHDLEFYEDSVVVEQVITRDGESESHTETKLICRITDSGSLEVETPGSQLRESVGLGNMIRTSPAMAALRLQYKLWLAPHMTLRYRENPLEEFRAGIDEGFTPVTAQRVQVGEQELVRVDLKSGDGLSGDIRASYEIFIDPESMLVVRVQGHQTMPDGATTDTTYEITPSDDVTNPAPV